MLAGVGLMLVFSFSLSWAWTLAGVTMRSPEAVFGLGNMVMFPLTFVSNVFVPVESLPGWLQAFVNVNRSRSWSRRPRADARRRGHQRHRAGAGDQRGAGRDLRPADDVRLTTAATDGRRAAPGPSGAGVVKGRPSDAERAGARDPAWSRRRCTRRSGQWPACWSRRSSSLVVVAQLRIVIRWYSGVPTMRLIRLCERRSLRRAK